MTQTNLLLLVGAAVALGFLFYPALMWRTLGALVKGFCDLVIDAFALLLAWI